MPKRQLSEIYKGIKETDVNCAILALHLQNPKFQGQVRLIFWIPPKVYAMYHANTSSVSTKVSIAFMDYLEKALGTEVLRKKVFDIQFQPAVSTIQAQTFPLSELKERL